MYAGTVRKEHQIVDRPSKVLLADDHTMFREALARLLTLEGDIEVVGQSTVGEGAVALVGEVKPDLVLTQVELPIERAKEYLSELLRVSSRPRILIVTGYEDPRLVRELLGMGACAYLVKNSTLEELLGAIRAAVRPEAEDYVAVAGISRGAFEQMGKGNSDGLLSEREQEILLLAARGLSSRQAANRLHLAEGTVKRHLTNVYHKMGVASRSEAVREAISMGIFDAYDITRAEEE